MKKIILILFLFSALVTEAQPAPFVDTTKFHVGKLNIQARDLESIRHIFNTRDAYDELLDSANYKFRRPGAPPSGSTVVVIDSVTIEALLAISYWMRTQDYEEVSFFYTRVDAAIKAVNQPAGISAFLQRKITELDVAAAARQDSQRTDNRRRLRGKQ